MLYDIGIREERKPRLYTHSHIHTYSMQNRDETFMTLPVSRQCFSTCQKKANPGRKQPATMAVATLLCHLLFTIHSVMDTALGSTVVQCCKAGPAGI